MSVDEMYNEILKRERRPNCETQNQLPRTSAGVVSVENFPNTT